MAQGTQPRFANNGRLRAYDAGGILGAYALNPVPYVEGDVKVSGLGRRLNQLIPVEVRGELIGAGYGARRFPQITLSEKICILTAAASPGPLRDLLTGTGAYLLATSTLGANRPFCVDIELAYEGTEFQDTDDVMKFNDCHFEHDFSEGGPNINGWTGIILGNVELNGVVVYRQIGSTGS